MKKTKKNGIVILLIVLLLALAIGYAAFSQSLPINGTATASGKWDVKFANPEITNSIVEGTTANSVTLGENGKSLDVVVNLATPGDGAKITVDITNAGDVTAQLKENGFKVSGDGFEAVEGQTGVYKNGAILVKVPTVDPSHTIVKDAKKTFIFTVEWDATVEKLADAQTAEFTITFDYEQAGVTGEFQSIQSFQ